MTVRVWNVWRGRQAAMQAWIGDGAMIVEHNADGTITLGCSDGGGAQTFDALVVRLATALSAP
jgi:hypothetical protein